MSNFFTDAAALIFKEPYTQKIGKLELSLTLRRNISEKNEITQNPIEQGSPITDHVRKLPTEISVDGMVSEMSLRNSILSSALRAENPLALNTNKLQDAYDELNRINDAQTPFDLQMPRRVYRNMLMQNLDFTSDASSGRALYFTCTFISMNIKSSQRVSMANAKIKADTAKAKTDTGKQPASPTTPSPKSTITLGTFLKGLIF